MPRRADVAVNCAFQVPAFLAVNPLENTPWLLVRTVAGLLHLLEPSALNRMTTDWPEVFFQVPSRLRRVPLTVMVRPLRAGSGRR